MSRLSSAEARDTVRVREARRAFRDFYRRPVMPLSTIQADVPRLIAANRSPDSYLAGATVLHRAEDTPRYDSVAQSAETDAATFTAAGCQFSWLLRTPTFHRAVVRVEHRALKIEWAQDSAFRFYPVQERRRALPGFG